jgi:hypothetical protein
MIALLCFFLTLFASPFKSRSLLRSHRISTTSHFPSRSQPIIQSLSPVSKELFLWKFLQVAARYSVKRPIAEEDRMAAHRSRGNRETEPITSTDRIRAAWVFVGTR